MDFSSPLLPTLAAYWNGAFQPLGGADFPVLNPATDAPLLRLPEYGTAHAEAAVDAAAEAARRAPPTLAQRGAWLDAIAAALRSHKGELARILTAENGKPLTEAEGEILYAAQFFTVAREHLGRLAPEVLEARPKGLTWTVHHRPAGVAALITPWNFPQGMLAKKLAGALAAGCPVVVKPSELTPLSCIALFTLLDRLDLPPGFVNLVFGRAPEIGQVLCARPEVRVISFTGSTEVGRLLARQAAPTLKRLSMELGGNAPFVVFEDADLDLAVDGLMANKFRCAGQTCVCANRVLVASAVSDAFVARVAQAIRRLRVGPGEEAVDVGPLIDGRGWRKVHAHVEDALSQGATLVAGGARGADGTPPEGGHFFPPTLLTGVAPDMRCAQEETFGPLVAVQTFEDEEEALSQANATEYGLAAYVFSGDSARLARAAARLHFGHVGLNSASGPTPEAPFGGMGASGVGREGGFEGVLEFVELQTCPSP